MKRLVKIFAIVMIITSPAVAVDGSVVVVGKNYVDSGLTQKVPTETIGNLDSLTTISKDNIVSAINEVNGKSVQANWNAVIGPSVILNKPAVGTSAGTIAAGDDSRFDTIPVGAPSGSSPAGRAFIWVEP